MRLTLDWDGEDIKDLHIEAVAEREPAGATQSQSRIAEFLGENDPDALTEQSDKRELWQSSGGEGYHYIEYDLNLSLERQRQLRRIYGDDANRISMDGMRIQNGSPFVNVMYHMKGIKPAEHKPYETAERAQLLVREGFDQSPTVETKDDETGRVDYQALISVLADHPDFGNRAALMRRIQRRDSVNVKTEAAKRGYDLAKGRRSPTRAEAKALRDYAQSRELGHYGDTTVDGQPAELAAKPARSTFHEYFEVPEIDFDQPPGEGESDWLPANLRTGSYGDVDEMTLKQVHDRLADALTDVLSPTGNPDMGGVTLNRWDRAISLERRRPLDMDEVARYRRVFANNQPGGGVDALEAIKETDPFDGEGHTIAWEMIVYTEDYGGVWWLARGLLDVSDGRIKNPLGRSTIVADTEGWL